MEARGVDLSDRRPIPRTWRWLTGYDGWSFYVHQCVLVPPARRARSGTAAARTPTAPGAPPISADGAASSAIPTTTCSRPSATRWTISPASSPSAAGAGSRSASRWTTTGSQRRRLRRAAARTCRMRRFDDATGLVNWQRAVKIAGRDRATCAAPRASSRRCTRASLELVEPGLRKHDLVAEIFAHRRSGAPRVIGGDYPAIVPLLPSGRRRLRGASHLGRPAVQDGRGHVLRDRRLLPPLPLPTLADGLPRQAAAEIPRRRAGGARRASRRRLEAARPGQQLRGIVEAAWRTVDRAHGIEKDSRTGYPIGLSYPPDWGERTMSLRPGDRTRARGRA